MKVGERGTFGGFKSKIAYSRVASIWQIWKTKFIKSQKNAILPKHEQNFLPNSALASKMVQIKKY